MRNFTKTYLDKDQIPINSWVGDFLLLIGAEGNLPAARMGKTWDLAFRAQNACLYFTEVSQDWRGAPLKIWQNENKLFWMLGVIWGNCASTNPADWPGHFLLVEYDQENEKIFFASFGPNNISKIS